jgi:dephospho-CoA kinase
MAIEQKIEEIDAQLEQIGMIGSPSTTSEFSLDILETAVNKKLVGELGTFHFHQDGLDNYAIGQITEIELRNVWLEGASLRSIARQRGTVNPISGQQDTHLGKMAVSAVFAQKPDKEFEQSFLGTVPATGTAIKIAEDALIQKILERQKDELFYLGNVYGSKPLLPLFFKHFASGAGGAGEAYHLGMFGKTGSGKSTLAKMALIGYMRHKNLGILVLDPQGEFSKEFQNTHQDAFKVPVSEVARKYGRETVVLGVKNLVLDRWELFEQILNESKFFERLTIPRGENRDIACTVLAEELQKKSIPLKRLHERASFDKAWEILKDDKIQMVFYRSEAPRTRFDSVIQNADVDAFYNEYWQPVASLFDEGRTNARKVEGALRWLIDASKPVRPVLVINLSHEQADNLFWNDRIQALVIKRLLQGLILTAEIAYKTNTNLNTLVLIDEAHRLAPRESPSDEVAKSVKNTLIKASRETRKYGLGWMFISQTLASLEKEIINMMRISFFGFGLSMGNEFQTLKEIAGGNPTALKLYQNFRDPHSALSVADRTYSFMTIGPVSPLSFSGTPLFLTAFNDIQRFKDVNGLG